MNSVVPSLTVLGNFAEAEKYYVSLKDFSILTEVQAHKVTIKQDVTDVNSPHYAVVHGNLRKYYACTNVLRKERCDWCDIPFNNVTLGAYTVDHLGVITRTEESSENGLVAEVDGFLCSPPCVLSASRIYDVCRNADKYGRHYEDLARSFFARFGIRDIINAPNKYIAEWNGGSLPKEEFFKPYRCQEAYVKKLTMVNVASYYEFSKP